MVIIYGFRYKTAVIRADFYVNKNTINTRRTLYDRNNRSRL